MTNNEEKKIILSAKKISKRFPGVTALEDVDLDIKSGQVHAIVGENGAGKSTLMKILSGVYQHYDGQIFLDGQKIAFKNPAEARQAGIAIIHQELNLLPHMSVAENIFLGREPINRFGFIDYNKMHTKTRTVLGYLKLDIPATTLVSSLRVGQQQIVEIAKALSLDARIIIMDEPTSAISEQEVAILFALIKDLVSKGVAIIYITHKLDELYKVGEHLTVLRDGKRVDSCLLAGLSRDDIVKKMVGRDIGNYFVKNHQTSQDVVLHVVEMSLPQSGQSTRFFLRDINLHVNKGEVLGIFGLMGAGRTELLETIFGLHPEATGHIKIAGHQVSITSPEHAIAAGIGYVPEDRKREGLILSMSIAHCVSLACIAQILQYGFLSTARENRLAAKYIDKLNIKTSGIAQNVETLSGGNQQKVVLAKWLATHPKVLLLDEPTRGIDINAKNEVYQIINQLAQSGLGIILVSSELPEILAIADRILVLSRGRITAEYAQQEASEEKILKAAIP
ncbi:sugar ABC transporter ATP-binding protein [candidate division KSB1 bacterium]|nr:sugar ABC transporter ATP-binding protein [candidate division KSB1 bacterium]RQW00832.1 MAG: sugar ABC transporter ATP-binding protein [candidate division KSB1 bacterium]